MNSKRHTIISVLQRQLGHDDGWLKKLSSNHFSLHLAIFREPYLTFIMEGKKTIETRFAKRPCPPFERVSDGDVVLLKEAGGEVSGICEVEKVWFYHLDPKAFAFIKNRFGKLICAVDSSFWTERECKTVATLMLIKNVIPISGVHIEKRDRRGWVVLQPKEEPSLF
jgi:ASC-1-like (ASCH) protein